MSPDSRHLHNLTVHHPQLKTSASSASLRSRETTPINMPVQADSAPAGGNVKVVVRVRAFLSREDGAANLIEMNPRTQQTTLLPPPENAQKASRKHYEKKVFAFDNSFWSIDPQEDKYADQVDVYNSLGEEFLDHNFNGYHTCIFAYGQTGSGKSYTMMGLPTNPGLIPRTCHDLFERINRNNSPNVSYSVRVSYFEVYNEHVRDLLVVRRDPPHYLKVRESPSEGPYIKDLTEVPVRDITEVLKWMQLGDKSRTVASTKMNDTSSRSHAVFTLVLKQMEHNMTTDETTERLARIRLVDLAGSERANSTGATGARLREGSNINKSLTTLGRVIAALADDTSTRRGSNKKKDVVPYRDSILTWLLKDSLGGNSKTAMVACISPTDYDETLSTLRYADQAKRIVTRAVINQDQVSRAELDNQIRALQETIRELQMSVSAAVPTIKQSDAENENMELYQREVRRIQHKYEEQKEVQECVIKSLKTRNEALERHLKLAIQSLKNPIPHVFPDFDNKENMFRYDDDSSEDEESEDEVENELLQGFLGDMQSFRRQLGEDRAKFGILKEVDTNTNTNPTALKYS